MPDLSSPERLKFSHMGVFFAEYVYAKESLTVTAHLPKEYGDSSLSVNPKNIELRTNLGTYIIELPNISVSCVTCRNLETFHGDSFSCTFSATDDKRPNITSKSLTNLESLLVNGDTLLCKFCSNRIVRINNIKSFKSQSPTFSLEDSTLGLETSYFCHSKYPNDKLYCNSKIQISKPELDAEAVSSSTCIQTGTEVVLAVSMLENGSCCVKGRKTVYCSRCLLCIGRNVSISSNELCALWTNCLNVLTEERDIDGDFLRYIEKPLIDESDFYGLFVAGLIENQCYRVIIAANTADGLIDFMLLWLIDQEVGLYTIPLPKLPISPAPPETASCEPPPLVDATNSPKLSTMTLRSDPVVCRRVFYKLILQTGTEDPQSETQELLKSWHRDFGVTLFSLPWETCIGLSTCLQQFTLRMAPQFRKPGQHMAGFTCGGVPLLNVRTTTG